MALPDIMKYDLLPALRVVTLDKGVLPLSEQSSGMFDHSLII